MGPDPHGTNTVAVPGWCRPCRLRGLGIAGDYRMLGDRGAGTARNHHCPKCGHGTGSSRGENPVLAARNCDLGSRGRRPSELCRWEPPLTFCGRLWNGQAEMVPRCWHLPGIRDDPEKRPGNTLARLEADVPKIELGKMTYWLVLGISGTAFVSGILGSFCCCSQPVSAALMTIPNSTIRVNSLFITGTALTKSAQGTRTFFSLTGHPRRGLRQALRYCLGNFQGAR